MAHGLDFRMSDAQEWDTLLDPGERIIWQGNPASKEQLEFDSVFSLLFMMMVWGGIALFVVITNPQSLILGVPGLFVGIALYFFVGQHVWAAYRRSCTFYSQSNTRAVFATSGPTGRKLDSDPITEQTALRLDERRKQAVWFGTTQGRPMFNNKTEHHLGFERLDSPREVHQLLRTIQRGDA